jgi:hypothetical protein
VTEKAGGIRDTEWVQLQRRALEIAARLLDTDPAGRQSLFERLAPNDPETRSEVAILLSSANSCEDFLARPCVGGSVTSRLVELSRLPTDNGQRE